MAAGYRDDIRQIEHLPTADPVLASSGVRDTDGARPARTHGEGQYIDQSQFETALGADAGRLLMHERTGREPVRDGNHDFVMGPTKLSRGARRQVVSIAVGTEDDGTRCARDGQGGAGAATTLHRRALRNKRVALDEIVTAWTRSQDRGRDPQTAGRWRRGLPLDDGQDIAEDPHLAERSYIVQLEHPEIGKRKHAGVPWKMSGTPCAVSNPAPIRVRRYGGGAQTLLGYSRDRVEQLQKAGVLA